MRKNKRHPRKIQGRQLLSVGRRRTRKAASALEILHEMHRRHRLRTRFGGRRENGGSENGVDPHGQVARQRRSADPGAGEQTGLAGGEGAPRAGEAVGSARAGVVGARVARRARLARAARLRHHR